MKIWNFKDKSNQIIGAIDVGTTKICALIGRKKREGVEILGIGLSSAKGINKGNIIDIKKASRAISEAISLAKEIAQEEPGVFLVSSAGSYWNSVNVENEILLSKTAKEVTAKEIEKVVQGAKAQVDLAGKKVIHLLPQTYQLDEQRGITNPQGMIGTRLKVYAHLISIMDNQYHNLLKSFQEAGIEVSELVFQPLASAVSVLKPLEREMGVVLADIGGGTTDIVIFHRDVIKYSAVIPLGGEHITSDLAIGLRTTKEEAETIKVQHGCAFSHHLGEEDTVEIRDLGSSSLQSISKKLMCQIIEARAKEIGAFLAREIRKSGLHKSLKGGLVITGGTAALEGFGDLLGAITGLPTRIGIPENTNLDGMVQTLSHPMFAAACGLLQLGMLLDSPQESTKFFFHHQANQGKKFLRQLKDYFMLE